MESLWLELVKNLEKQEDNIIQLLNIAREHNRALRQLDAGKLAEIVGREESVAGIIGRYEKERKKITDKLARELSFKKDAVLSQFAEKAPPDIGEKLYSLLENMSGSVLELTGINRLNGDLTRQAMRFNAIILKTFSPAGKNVYTPQGKKADDSPNLSLLDKKV
ncbi:MAG: flagellar protein FlgN [Firmicutes bacterium]|nr:flagellar protein FlgN [Bacillota bacterium]